MPVVNLSEFSVPELRELMKDIDKEIKQRQAEKKKHVLLQMRELAAEIGMTVEQVLAPEMQKQTKAGKIPGRPKYRNPDPPHQTWTGRGKRPGWIKEAIERGKALEDFEIR